MTSRVSTKLEAHTNFIKRYLRELHTGLPAKILAIDYSKPSVTVKPMLSTRFDDITEEVPVIYDVPLQTLAVSNDVKISIPFKVGGNVALLFSERDSGGFIESGNAFVSNNQNTHGLYPLIAVPMLSAGGVNFEVDPEDIVVQNKKSKLTEKPDGTIIIGNGNGTFKLLPDGSFDINGLKITKDGNLITAKGVDADAHIHDKVQGGNSNSGKPVIS